VQGGLGPRESSEFRKIGGEVVSKRIEWVLWLVPAGFDSGKANDASERKSRSLTFGTSPTRSKSTHLYVALCFSLGSLLFQKSSQLSKKT